MIEDYQLFQNETVIIRKKSQQINLKSTSLKIFLEKDNYFVY